LKEQDMHMRTKTAGMAILLAMGSLAAVPAPPHITPTVVMRKQADVIRAALPEATQFFVKSVTIGQNDFRQLSEAGFEPDADEMNFYYGIDGSGVVVGVVLFPQINTSLHGPIEVGLTINPDETIRGVVVTKATVETKPWVQAVERTGFVDQFTGLGLNGDPEAALAGVSKDSMGEMPYYFAGLIARDVANGLALYRTLYQ
jgi:hypothetical protein